MNVPENGVPVDGEPDWKGKKTPTESNIKAGGGFVTHRYDRCWDEIFPYLSRLDDMMAVFDSCSYLRSLVENFLSNQNPELTVDNESLSAICQNRFPDDEEDHPYVRFGPLVTNLTVCKVSESDFKNWICYCFTNIRSLHLQRMLLLDLDDSTSDSIEWETTFPHLIALKLTECVINPSQIDEIIDTVKSLHLNWSTIPDRIVKIPWNNGWAIPKYCMPRPQVNNPPSPSDNQVYADIVLSNNGYESGSSHLRHLILERVSHSNSYSVLNLHYLESLKIINCHENVTMKKLEGFGDGYMGLKSLSLETLASIRDLIKNVSRLNLDCLENLTLSDLISPLNWLGELKELKQLRILQPIQNSQEVALTEALSAMKNEINVKYSVYQQPEVNQIINVLNEDCLREILSYLTVDDIFNLIRTHSTFKELISLTDVASIGISVLIDEQFLSKHPLNQQLIEYQSLGYSLSKLTLKCSEDEFTTLVPCFPHLRILNFDGLKDWNWTDRVIELFPMVEALEFPEYKPEIPQDIIIKLLCKLQPTLKVFYGPYNDADFEYVQHLRKFKQLRINGQCLNHDMDDFWKHNQSLEALHLMYHINDNPHHGNQKRNWEEIVNLKKLTALHVGGQVYRGIIPTMKHIKELALEANERKMCEAFLNAIGSQLERLHVYDSRMDPEEVLALMPHCKNLKYYEYHTHTCIFEFFKAKQIIECLLEQPNLIAIRIEYIIIDFYEDFQDLQNFLIATNRVLYFNGVKYPQ